MRYRRKSFPSRNILPLRIPTEPSSSRTFANSALPPQKSYGLLLKRFTVQTSPSISMERLCDMAAGLIFWREISQFLAKILENISMRLFMMLAIWYPDSTTTFQRFLVTLNILTPKCWNSQFMVSTLVVIGLLIILRELKMDRNVCKKVFTIHPKISSTLSIFLLQTLKQLIGSMCLKFPNYWRELLTQFLFTAKVLSKMSLQSISKSILRFQSCWVLRDCRRI